MFTTLTCTPSLRLSICLLTSILPAGVIWLNTPLPRILSCLILLTLIIHVIHLIRLEGLRTHPQSLIQIKKYTHTHCLYYWPNGQSLGRYPLITHLYGPFFCLTTQARHTYGQRNTLCWVPNKKQTTWQHWHKQSKMKNTPNIDKKAKSCILEHDSKRH